MTSNPQHYLTVKDHSISNEEFELLYDESLDLVYTFPKPDENSLPKYYESEDYISHTDGKRSLFEKVYQIVKNIAIQGKIKIINKYIPNKGNLLDIGAGTGDFLIHAKKNEWKITGIEPNIKAKTIAESKGVAFVENLEALQSNFYDAITMWHVLEHVPDIEKQIIELKRLLKPNGVILIAVPNFNSFDAKYYKDFWAAYDVPRHLWHFSKTSVKILFERKKLQLQKIIPLPFDAFYVSLLSEKYKSGRMNFFKAFFIGLKSNWKGYNSGEFSSHIYVIRHS